MGANLSVLSFPKMKRRRVSRQELLEEQKLYAYLDGKHFSNQIDSRGRQSTKMVIISLENVSEQMEV